MMMPLYMYSKELKRRFSYRKTIILKLCLIKSSCVFSKTINRFKSVYLLNCSMLNCVLFLFSLLISINLVGSSSLSKQDVHYHAYTYEGFLREASYDFYKALGEDWEKTMNQFSYVLVKPDALAARSLEALFLSLQNSGFEPLACVEVNLTPNTWRSIWRYQIYRAPVARLVLLDRLYSMSISYLILVQDVSRSSFFSSASARLKSIKGGAHSYNRKKEDLRSLIGAKTGVLSFIHTPDESLDMIREFGILLSREQRYNIAKVIHQPVAFFPNEELYQNIPYHNLNVLDCTKRIEGACQESELIISLCDLVNKNQNVNVEVDELLNEFDRLNVEINPWDIITFCANFSEAN